MVRNDDKSQTLFITSIIKSSNYGLISRCYKNSGEPLKLKPEGIRVQVSNLKLFHNFQDIELLNIMIKQMRYCCCEQVNGSLAVIKPHDTLLKFFFHSLLNVYLLFLN